MFRQAQAEAQRAAVRRFTAIDEGLIDIMRPAFEDALQRFQAGDRMALKTIDGMWYRLDDLRLARVLKGGPSPLAFRYADPRAVVALDRDLSPVEVLMAAINADARPGLYTHREATIHASIAKQKLAPSPGRRRTIQFVGGL